jgi:CDP-paratose 2-epimerase
LREHGVEFIHGDIRRPEDLAEIPAFDLLLDCSAEPSVHAGASGSPAFVLHTNLTGTIHLLEAARVHGAAVLFLSTSRVYPIEAINALAVDESPTRFEWRPDQGVPGLSEYGIAEDFSLDGPRSFYGTTKLASEYLLQEYHYACGTPALINRCGMLAGPWQMGKVDQGVFAFWLFHHHFGLPLSYIGYGGTGKQVRDLLHVDDLCELIELQLSDPDAWAGFKGNVGGGRDCSLSLLETTEICRELTGSEVPIEPVADQRPGDVPIYLSDCRRLLARTSWRPSRDARTVMEDIYAWTLSHEGSLERSLGLDRAGAR